MSAEIWYMDSEFCDACDTLLDGFGVCPECGYDGGYYEEEEDDEDWFWEEDMYDENQAIVSKAWQRPQGTIDAALPAGTIRLSEQEAKSRAKRLARKDRR